MSEAKYEYECWLEGQETLLCKHEKVRNYVTELKQQNRKLIEDITDIGIDKIHLEQQSKELKELLDDSEQRRKDLMFSLRNVLDRKKELEQQNKELIATLQIVKDVIEMNPAGAYIVTGKQIGRAHV